jgi:hypothetical protein
MILPQTDGFRTLRNRVHAIATLGTMSLIKTANRY